MGIHSPTLHARRLTLLCWLVAVICSTFVERLSVHVVLHSGRREVLLVMKELRCCAELMDLREKFAEDKRRIAEMKAARKFKPV